MALPTYIISKIYHRPLLNCPFNSYNFHLIRDFGIPQNKATTLHLCALWVLLESKTLFLQTIKKPRCVSIRAFGYPKGINKALDDDLLSHGETPHYHRRGPVSLLSSEWDQVVHSRYGRQAKLGQRWMSSIIRSIVISH